MATKAKTPAATGPVIIPFEYVEKMTQSERVAYVRYLQTQEKLLTLWDYIHEVSPWVEPYDNLIVLCQHLDALVEGRLYVDGPGPFPVQTGERIEKSGKRTIKVPIMAHPTRGDSPVYQLAIYEPPRHGKSLVVSEHYMGYLGTKYPGIKLMGASYGDDLAELLSTKLQNHVEDGKATYSVAVKGGNRAKKAEWSFTNLSQFICGGMGSGFTGKGRQAGVADDLIKDREAANSESVRQSTYDWYNDVWITRREPWFDGTPCRDVIMNTRWHTDDISGRVVEKNPEKWCVLRIPALAEENDPLGRQPGEALIPEIMNTEALLHEQERNPAGFASLYQGRPYVLGGNMIHDPFNLALLDGGQYKLVDRDGIPFYCAEAACFRFQIMDLAATLKKSSDWTVIGTFDITPAELGARRIILRAVKRMKITTEDHEGEVVLEYRRMGAKFIGVEDKTFGTNLINRLRKRGGITVRPIKADSDKVTRALPIDSLVRMEQLWWMEQAAWRSDFEAEVLAFPDVAHDDQVDVLAYAVRIFEALPTMKAQEQAAASTMQDRIAKHMKKLNAAKKGKGGFNHPSLGSI